MRIGHSDLSCPRYIWNLIKNSTSAERLFCAFAIMALMVCIALILIFTMWQPEIIEQDSAPHEWNITRQMWLAANYSDTQSTKTFEPLHLVIIQHTVSPECKRFKVCAAEIRNLQCYFLTDNKLGYDIPYNFLIGNEGRVYEGRGLGIVGAHTYGYNSCSIGLGFIGDYREDAPGHASVTPLQVKNVHRLLDNAVKMGYLHPDYYVVGGKDLRSTKSPGSNLYREIQRWPHYDHKGLFRGKNCSQIHAMFQESNIKSKN